jgi:DNA (cytosine-5)-methyltransferase 1
MPALYLAIIGELQKRYRVEFAVFENVPGIRDQKHSETYRQFLADFGSLGFEVKERELLASDFGVAQRRRRLVVCGLRSGAGYLALDPKVSNEQRTVRDVIGDLGSDATFYRRGLRPEDIALHPNHWTMVPKSRRFSTASGGRSDGRSFKRLDWEAPSPTLAFGHREIHVHPNGTRRLTIYEAMLLQGFPTSFVVDGNLSEQAEQVSNAVPPPMARSVAHAIRRSILG